MHELLGVDLEFIYLGIMNIQSDHPIPGVDSLIARLNERHPAAMTSVVPTTEGAAYARAALSFQQISGPHVSTIDMGRGFSSLLRKRSMLPMIPGRIVTGSPVAPVAPASVAEEGVPDFRDDNYTSLSTGVPAGELIEIEQLALALKASMDTALEERVPRAASLLFHNDPDNFPIPVISPFWVISPFLFMFCYQGLFNIYALIVLSVGNSFLGEPRGTRWNS